MAATSRGSGWKGTEMRQKGEQDGAHRGRRAVPAGQARLVNASSKGNDGRPLKVMKQTQITRARP
jgi:hypothetical protein